MTRRTVRVSETLRMELATLVARDRALEGQMITIVSVETPPDLKQAFVYFSVIDPKESPDNLILVLNKRRHEWQKQIAHRLRMKHTPVLIFRHDQSVERGDRVFEIIQELEQQTEGLRGSAGATETPPEEA
jgi:ribosome-binding factor A